MHPHQSSDIPIFVEPGERRLCPEIRPALADRAVAMIQASLVEPQQEPLPVGPAVQRIYGRPLRLLSGRPVLCHLIDRLRRAVGIERVIVALSVAPEDDALAAVARGAGVEVFRGSVFDLVGRLVSCAEWLNLPPSHPVVRVMADTPLIDPLYLNAGLFALQQTRAGAVEFIEEESDELCPGLSAGFVRVSTLKLLDRRARTAPQRADVMNYIYEHPGEAGLLRRPLPESLSYLVGDHRLLLHTAEDLALLEALHLRLYVGDPIETRRALRCLDADPALAALNRGMMRKAFAALLPAGAQ